MPDDKSKSKQDRKLVSAKQPYELDHFCRKWGLTRTQGRFIIAKHGPSRRKCDEAAKAFLLT